MAKRNNYVKGPTFSGTLSSTNSPSKPAGSGAGGLSKTAED